MSLHIRESIEKVYGNVAFHYREHARKSVTINFMPKCDMQCTAAAAAHSGLDQNERIRNKTTFVTRVCGCVTWRRLLRHQCRSSSSVQMEDDR